MPSKHDYPEDLFEGTKMTFGEHLEELRKCFFRALVGLLLAFIVTLVFKWADKVIQFIQTPLKSSLETFHIEKAADDAERLVERMQREGLPAPDVEAVQDKIRTSRFLPTLYYVDPREVLFFSNPSQAADEPQDEVLAPITFWRPVADDPRIAVTSLSPHEMFMIWMKAAILVSVVVASPWIFYQIWSFVAAGLFPHEKRYVHIYLPFSIGLFLAGQPALCFFFVFEPVLDFLFTFNKAMQVDPDMRISEWFGFAIFLPLGFGIAFQLPLVMLFLERIGVFTPAMYLAKWRLSILVIFVISMVLTPADPYSMLFLAVPLTFLYFGGILLCKALPRNRNPFGNVEEAA